jgi:hypothetical protein
MFKRFFDANKGGSAGASGSDVAETPVSQDATETNTGNEAFLNALGFDEATRASLQPKQEVTPPKPPIAEAEVDDDDAELPASAGNDKMLRRINKLTARLKAAEAEAAALKAKPPEQPAAKPTPQAAPKDDVFFGIDTAAQLATLVTQARETEAWVESIEARWDAEGQGDVEVSDGNGGKTVLTPAQVKAYAKRASTILRDRADATERIAAREQSLARATARFPHLAKSEAERTPAEKQVVAVAKGIREKAPEFSRFPDSEYIINLIAEAIIADTAKGTAATAEPKPKTPIAPPPPLGVGGSGESKPAARIAEIPASFDEASLADFYKRSA